jgi:hypothetical protein
MPTELYKNKYINTLTRKRNRAHFNEFKSNSLKAIELWSSKIIIMAYRIANCRADSGNFIWEDYALEIGS